MRGALIQALRQEKGIPVLMRFFDHVGNSLFYDLPYDDLMEVFEDMIAREPENPAIYRMFARFLCMYDPEDEARGLEMIKVAERLEQEQGR